METLAALDLRSYYLINHGLVSGALDRWMVFLSANLTWVGAFIIGVILAAITRSPKHVRVLCVVLAALSISDFLCGHVFKPAAGRIRPCHTLSNSRRVDGVCGGTFTMPSNHASNGAAVTAVLTTFLPPAWMFLSIACTLAVGFSRVYLGVHYPADVLMGFMVGSVLGIIIVRVTRSWVEGTSHELGDQSSRSQSTVG